LFSHGCVKQIQRLISNNSILVPFMYAYGSNYSCMPTVQTIHVCLLFKLFMSVHLRLLQYKLHLTKCRNCLPFQCGFIHKQSYYLVRCCSFAFNFQCNVFICLSSIISSCLVLTLSLYYRSSFSLRFVLFFYFI
jgi:hypothetical protein